MLKKHILAPFSENNFIRDRQFLLKFFLIVIRLFGVGFVKIGLRAQNTMLILLNTFQDDKFFQFHSFLA